MTIQNMTIHILHSVATGVVFAEMTVLLIMMLPFMSATIWEKLFRSRFFRSLKENRVSFFFSSLFLMISLLLFQSLKEMSKYKHIEVDEIMFQAERNCYNAGFAIFMALIIQHIISLLSHQVELTESLRQAKSTSAAAIRTMKETETIQADIRGLRATLEAKKKELDQAKHNLEVAGIQFEITYQDYSKLLEEHQKLQDEHSKLKHDYESILENMQERLKELEKQQAKFLSSADETERNINVELELKEKRIVKAEEDLKQYEDIVKQGKEVSELNKKYEEETKQLQHKLELTENALEDEKRILLQEFSQEKTAAISLMEQECVKKITAVEEAWKVKCEALQSSNDKTCQAQESMSKVQGTENRKPELDVNVKNDSHVSLKSFVYSWNLERISSFWYLEGGQVYSPEFCFENSNWQLSVQISLKDDVFDAFKVGIYKIGKGKISNCVKCKISLLDDKGTCASKVVETNFDKNNTLSRQLIFTFKDLKKDLLKTILKSDKVNVHCEFLVLTTVCKKPMKASFASNVTNNSNGRVQNLKTSERIRKSKNLPKSPEPKKLVISRWDTNVHTSREVIFFFLLFCVAMLYSVQKQSILQDESDLKNINDLVLDTTLIAVKVADALNLTEVKNKSLSFLNLYGRNFNISDLKYPNLNFTDALVSKYTKNVTDSKLSLK